MTTSSPLARRITYLNEPPGRRSTSHSGMVQSGGVIQRGTRSARVQASKTSRQGALNSRDHMISRSDGVDVMSAGLSMGCTLGLLILKFDQQVVESCEAFLPEGA